MYGWGTFLIFVSVLYLSGSITRSLLVGLFVLISCSLGFGRRWLLRGVLVISILALAVSLGFPSPSEWLNLAKPGMHYMLGNGDRAVAAACQ